MLYFWLKMVYPIDAYDFALYIISQFTHEVIRTILKLQVILKEWLFLFLKNPKEKGESFLLFIIQFFDKHDKF